MTNASLMSPISCFRQDASCVWICSHDGVDCLFAGWTVSFIAQSFVRSGGQDIAGESLVIGYSGLFGLISGRRESLGPHPGWIFQVDGIGVVEAERTPDPNRQKIDWIK